MAVKTFGSERLVSTDINTYLANSGLVYVGEFTASGSSRALVCDNIFTSTYLNYKVVVKLGSTSNTNILYFQTIDTNGNTASTGYYSGSYAKDFSTAGASGVSVINSTTAAYIGYVANGLGNPTGAEFTIYAPRLAEWSTVNGQYTGINSGVQFQAGEFYAIINPTPATMRGLRFDNTAGTNLTGKVTVYGYRNA